MIDMLPGRRCTSIRRLQHQFADQLHGETGPIEFTWDDGTSLTLDANADWTLDISGRPWTDPFDLVSGSERSALAEEVGLWSDAPIPRALGRLVGQVVTSVDPEFNEVGELTGLNLAFETQALSVRVLGGDVTVEVIDR